jgi:DNA-directed RNA polymerase subunit RPC12/RpoP
MDNKETLVCYKCGGQINFKAEISQTDDVVCSNCNHKDTLENFVAKQVQKFIDKQGSIQVKL